MKCSYCGNELTEKDKVCSFCGQPVEGAGDTREAEGQRETEDGPKAEGQPEESPGQEKFWQGEAGDQKEEPAKPAGLSKVKLAGIVVAAAAVLGLGGLAAAKLLEKDPKEVVIAAFENIYTEDQVDPMEELFGLSQFQQYAAAGSQQAGTELVLEGCSEEQVNQLAGSGIRTEFKYDQEKKKGSFDLGVLFNHMDLAKLNLYYGDETVMAAIPELSSKVFTLDVGEGLVERLESSPTLGPVLEDSDVDLEELALFYQEYMDWIQSRLEKGTAADPYGIKAAWKRYREGSQAQDNFKAALAVEKAEKGTFQMDGKEVSCKGYRVYINKDSLISFLRASSDFFLQDKELKENFLENLRMSLRMIEITGNTEAAGALGNLSPEEQLEDNYEEVKKSVDEAIDALDKALGNIEMLVHVDPKGRLAGMEGTTSLEDEGEILEVSFSLALQGGSYLTQNARGKIALTKGEEDMNLEMLKQGTYDGSRLTGDLSLDLYGSTLDHRLGLMMGGTYDNEAGDFSVRAELAADQDKAFGLQAAGVVSELEKGSVLHMDVDELRMDVPGDGAFGSGKDLYVALSGEYDLRPLSGEVTEPAGEKMDILAATEEDWQRVMMEVYMGAMDIASQLGSVMN